MSERNWGNSMQYVVSGIFWRIDDIACIYSLRNGWGRLWSSYSLCSYRCPIQLQTAFNVYNHPQTTTYNIQCPQSPPTNNRLHTMSTICHNPLQMAYKYLFQNQVDRSLQYTWHMYYWRLFSSHLDHNILKKKNYQFNNPYCHYLMVSLSHMVFWTPWHNKPPYWKMNHHHPVW
jgi:hypothetical protein